MTNITANKIKLSNGEQAGCLWYSFLGMKWATERPLKNHVALYEECSEKLAEHTITLSGGWFMAPKGGFGGCENPSTTIFVRRIYVSEQPAKYVVGCSYQLPQDLFKFLGQQHPELKGQKVQLLNCRAGIGNKDYH